MDDIFFIGKPDQLKLPTLNELESKLDTTDQLIANYETLRRETENVFYGLLCRLDEIHLQIKLQHNISKEVMLVSKQEKTKNIKNIIDLLIEYNNIKELFNNGKKQ